jgi:hypothetical protein
MGGPARTPGEAIEAVSEAIDTLRTAWGFKDEDGLSAAPDVAPAYRIGTTGGSLPWLPATRPSPQPRTALTPPPPPVATRRRSRTDSTRTGTDGPVGAVSGEIPREVVADAVADRQEPADRQQGQKRRDEDRQHSPMPPPTHSPARPRPAAARATWPPADRTRSRWQLSASIRDGTLRLADIEPRTTGCLWSPRRWQTSRTPGPHTPGALRRTRCPASRTSRASRTRPPGSTSNSGWIHTCLIVRAGISSAGRQSRRPPARRPLRAVARASLPAGQPGPQPDKRREA